MLAILCRKFQTLKYILENKVCRLENCKDLYEHVATCKKSNVRLIENCISYYSK